MEVAAEIEIAGEGGPPQPPMPTPQSSHPVVSALLQNFNVQETLARDSSLFKHLVNSVMAAKAPATVRAYSAALRSVEEFMTGRGYPYPHFDRSHMLEYVLSKIADNVPFHAIAKIKPAVSFLDEALGRSSSFTPETDLAIAGAKRLLRASKGPVKKAPTVTVNQLRRLFEVFVIPFLGARLNIDIFHLRSLFRVVVEYHTLCRLDDFRKLKAKHFERIGADIAVTFPSAKNDQHHDGRTSVIVAAGSGPDSGSEYCPVRVIKMFFRRVGLSFGAEAKDENFVNVQFRRSAAGLIPIKSNRRCLSASGSTEALRASFAAADINVPKVTDKSIKMAGVTTAFNGGASSEQVMHLGRWQTTSVPHHYKVNSFEFKRNVAALIPDVGKGEVNAEDGQG